MKEIISLIPPECRINLFSATMPKEIVQLTSNFMNEPAKILVKNEELTLLGIKQYYVTLKKEWKLETLMNLYKGLDIAQAIIFCNSKKGVETLTEEMRKKGHMVSCIHSDLPMSERAKVMNEFRSGVTRVLISTDLTARGIDVYQVSIVVNYDLPTQKETYIHRIGRSGRFGKKGNAINFILPEEKEQLDSIMKFYDTTIEQLPQDLSEIK
jgi:translation initiation factor 4A